MNMEEMIDTKGIKTKPLAQTIIDTWNTKVDEKIIQLYAPDYEGEDFSGSKKRSGIEGVKGWLNNVLHAFPNIHYTLIDYVENDERLVLHWIADGNHHGSFLKIPASGKPVTINGISLLKIEHGKIKEGKLFWDLAGVLRQIGLLPSLP
ncbi:MAG TPA: ester cyclase [Chitinophagaceae bacterium]|nr:ester cyclase [Chitinophagaceae bacterium]